MAIAIQRVFVDDMEHQLLPTQHYEEVPFGSGSLPFDLDLDSYRILEDSGNLLGLAAFDQSNLVGYIVVMTTPMLHCKGNWLAVADSFYVHPDYRKQGVFEELLHAAEEQCKLAGVVALRLGVNQNFKLPECMLNGLGYTQAEVIYQQEF